MYKFVKQNLEKQKREMDSWYTKRVAGLPLSKDIILEQDIPYAEDGKDCHRMDVYRPRGREEKLPVIFDFHGGGLLLCDRKVNRWFCSEMAMRGFLVFCIDYPLAPESLVYDILRDSYAGVCKAYQLIENYGGDSSKIFLCGDSAGAFIATYLSALQRNGEMAASLGIDTLGLGIKALAAISGMFYSSRIDRQGIFILRRDFYGKHWKTHPFWAYVNPEHPGILKSLPPTVCVTSGGDYLRDYTLRFARTLERAGGNVVLENYKDDPALSHDFVCLMTEKEEAQDAMDKVAEFFRMQ